MANHPSALKRHRQSLKRRSANRTVKARIGTLVNTANDAVAAGDKEAAETALVAASKALAKGASEGTLHSRTASRRTSRLARKVAKLSN